MRQLCARSGNDDDAATQELRFLTPKEAMLHFGPPNHLGSGGDYWEWETSSPDGTRSNLWVRFGSGFVTIAGASQEID